MEAPVEKVTIQEASRRLNLSQREIREFIRKGELKAERDAGSESGRWMVEMPGDGWEDPVKTFLNNLSDKLTPWWWASSNAQGRVHYLENMGIEEIMPDFLCGLRGESVYPATGHTQEQRCPKCVDVATTQGLRLWNEELGQS